MADFRIEKRILSQGYSSIAGVDEVGRGALFGPVVAACVVFPAALIQKSRARWFAELDDSKTLTASKREDLADWIAKNALSTGIGIADHSEIDQSNIHQASLKAMQRAVENLAREPDFILVDGFSFNYNNCPLMGIPQGDQKSGTIAAASILAKVHRDEMMKSLDRIYQGYSLTENKGYGTKSHFSALEDLGPSPLHRKSFNLKKIRNSG